MTDAEKAARHFVNERMHAGHQIRLWMLLSNQAFLRQLEAKGIDPEKLPYSLSWVMDEDMIPSGMGHGIALRWDRKTFDWLVSYYQVDAMNTE